MARRTGRIPGIAGRWRITETDLWGEHDLDLIGSPEIVFAGRGEGSLRVGALQAELDYRKEERAGVVKAEFTWAGVDDMDPVNGRGWVELEGAAMRGELFIHMGDDVTFKAVSERPTRKRTSTENG